MGKYDDERSKTKQYKTNTKANYYYMERHVDEKAYAEFKRKPFSSKEVK